VFEVEISIIGDDTRTLSRSQIQQSSAASASLATPAVLVNSA
jgi:hypothetical protein